MACVKQWLIYGYNPRGFSTFSAFIIIIIIINPFLFSGLYLQDLTFLEEQPNKLEDKISINFGKRWKQFKSVDHIRFAQTK